MTITPTVLIEPKLAEATNTVQYTATGVNAIVDKFTVTNNGAAVATITINVPTNLGTADASNRIVNSRNIEVGECYTCPELVGQVLLDADYISTTASLATTLTIRASGRTITL
tara:strand:- start:1783 stop:2121 length:339 start_codon:yes stop_codon:yes gene_type:complete